MKKEKDITDLFKDNQHKLSERPSDRAWQKLDRRLDVHRRQTRTKRRNLYPLLSMAAALLFLVVCVAVISDFFGKSPQTNVATTKADNATAGVAESLESPSAAPQALKVVFQKDYKKQARTIDEGKPNQKLLSAKKNSFSLKKLGEYTIVLDSLQKANIAASKLAGKDELKTSEKFQWLLGDWQGNSPNGKSLEQWQKTDEQTIQGKGYLVQQEGIQLIDKMELKKEGEDWFYITYLDNNASSTKYRLKSYQNYQAIFENTNISFPNQLILQRFSDTKFSTILQNKTEDTINMKESQTRFLGQRNVVTDKRVIRNLVVVE